MDASLINIIVIIIESIIFYGIPLAVVIGFIVSLVRFIKADKSDTAEYKKRRNVFVVFAIAAGVLILAVAALIILIALAVAHM